MVLSVFIEIHVYQVTKQECIEDIQSMLHNYVSQVITNIY